jgi:hypothetical protein
MSDSNPIAVLERTLLIVYEADIFNCSPQSSNLRLSNVFGQGWKRGNPLWSRPARLTPASDTRALVRSRISDWRVAQGCKLSRWERSGLKF